MKYIPDPVKLKYLEKSMGFVLTEEELAYLIDGRGFTTIYRDHRIIDVDLEIIAFPTHLMPDMALSNRPEESDK